MHLASVYRDAVLTFIAADQLSRGETLLELTEATYTAFRDRQNSIHRNNTCNCQACQRVPTLDLKFLVHYGQYVAQPSGSDTFELSGLDAHLMQERLLKDQVPDSSEHRSYVLFTDRSLEHLGVWPEGMSTTSAHYAHVGEIRTASLDLRPQYAALVEARRIFISPDEADLVLTYQFAAPRPVLWEWLNDPDTRTRWMKWRTWTEGLRPGGRTGIGASNHCAHGMGMIVETVLDWRPHDYFTVEMAQDSIRFAMVQTYQLEPLTNGRGTRLHFHVAFRKPGPRWLMRPLLKGMTRPLWRSDLERLAALMVNNEVDR